jgi:ankyrin repeat protein
MSLTFSSSVKKNTNRKKRNSLYHQKKLLSVSNPMSKFPTYDSITTMLETNRSEDENEEIIFIENFFKEKYKIFNEYPDESFSNNKIIHKWYVLINVFIAIIHMSKIKLQKLSTSNFSELLKGKLNKKRNCIKEKNNISNNSLLTSNNINKDIEMNYILDQIKLFQLIRFGIDKYEKDIIDLLKKHNFVNDKNYENLTPLYIASINGNEKMVKLLIDHGANYLLLDVNNESILDISVRWNYYKLTNFLLLHCKWPINYIKNAYRLIQNKDIRKLFIKYKKKEISLLC